MVVCGCSTEESEGERVTEMGLRCGRVCMCSTVHSHRARERRERERGSLLYDYRIFGTGLLLFGPLDFYNYKMAQAGCCVV